MLPQIAQFLAFLGLQVALRIGALSYLDRSIADVLPMHLTQSFGAVEWIQKTHKTIPYARTG